MLNNFHWIQGLLGGISNVQLTLCIESIIIRYFCRPNEFSYSLITTAGSSIIFVVPLSSHNTLLHNWRIWPKDFDKEDPVTLTEFSYQVGWQSPLKNN